MEDGKTAPAAAPSLTSKLWSVGSLTLFASVMGNVALVSANYGQQSTELGVYKDQIIQLQKDLEKRDESLKKWSDAFDQRGVKIAELQSRIRELENDRCEPLSQAISELRFSIERPYSPGYAETIDSMRSMMQQYQETLRACYAARTI